MSRKQRYLDIDVLTAARQRVQHVFDIFDTVVVAFSGGKDSLVCLHLVREEAERRGALPVKVIFRDEEVIPDQVVDFVNQYRQQPWIDMRWFCYPLINNKFIMGEHRDYVQWDPRRKWVRDMPEWGMRPKDPYATFGQHDMDELACEGYKGKVGLVSGIRADESLVRLRSVVNKLNENYITQPGGYKGKRIKMVKPIYDWRENDVFKFLSDEGIPWCPWYDLQHVSGHPLRVATPLHAESSKRLGNFARIDPGYYHRVMESFPEMDVQARYWGDYDRDSLKNKYGDGFTGCERYIRENITDKVARSRAMARLKECRQLNQTKRGQYPPELLLRALMSGAIERTLLPKGRKKTA